MDQSLKDKTILLIGGTSGIGWTAAQAMLQAGARVVVAGRDDEHLRTARDWLAEHAPGRHLALGGNAADPGLADAAVSECVETFGRLDGLYHVAGGSGRRFGDGPLDEVTDDGVHHTLAINLESVVWSNRAALRQFLAQGDGGSVVNTGSVLARSPSARFFSTHIYAAAKAGIEGLTRAAAARYAPENIRFNVIAPGLVDTPMARRAAEDESIQQFAHTKQPLDGGRIGQPGDLDGTAIYLLSDASRFVTGQVLAVDGGWSVSEGQYP